MKCLKRLVFVLLFLASCCSGYTGDWNIIDQKGNLSNPSKILGKQYKLVLLLKAWDGESRDLIDGVRTYLSSLRGRVRPVLIFVKSNRAVVNEYVKDLELKHKSYIDKSGAFINDYHVSFLPTALLLDSQNKVIHRSTVLREDFLKTLSSNPSKTLRIMSRRHRRGIPTLNHISSDSGPWGPPEPRDPVFSGIE